jgi:hypothetical protein
MAKKLAYNQEMKKKREEYAERSKQVLQKRRDLI